jgi:DNA-directed RNA polymerase subunit RPC12/RpoP
MNICTDCKKEMVCIKNGMIARWGQNHCYAGDLYQCPECNMEILTGLGKPFYSDNPIAESLLIQMDQE